MGAFDVPDVIRFAGFNGPDDRFATFRVGPSSLRRLLFVDVWLVEWFDVWLKTAKKKSNVVLRNC